MYTRESLQAEVHALTQEHGEWSYDIPLPFGIWTRGNEGVPHGRLRRLVQAATDACGGSLTGRRVLDLGCLEGLFAIEFAKHGATAVGIEIRESNLAKARLCKAALELPNLDFVQDDVRNISVEKYGKFDVIICSGILYHLQEQAGFELMRSMFDMSDRAVIVDTHVALDGTQVAEHRGVSYQGSTYREHADGSSQSDRARRLWASWDNTTSFWLTRSSLVNLMLDCGYTSVYECLMSPPHERDRASKMHDRCTLMALKGSKVEIHMNPRANEEDRRWREGALSYGVSARVGEVLRAIERRGTRVVRKLLNSR